MNTKHSRFLNQLPWLQFVIFSKRDLRSMTDRVTGYWGRQFRNHVEHIKEPDVQREKKTTNKKQTWQYWTHSSKCESLYSGYMKMCILVAIYWRAGHFRVTWMLKCYINSHRSNFYHGLCPQRTTSTRWDVCQMTHSGLMFRPSFLIFKKKNWIRK